MELNPGCADTLVVSWHKDVLWELSSSPYEATALLWLALEQEGLRRPGEPPEIRNFQLGFLLAPVFFLTPSEFVEAVDRLDARGFVERVGARESLDQPRGGPRDRAPFNARSPPDGVERGQSRLARPHDARVPRSGEHLNQAQICAGSAG
ncbi:hypothetical protein ACWGRV_27115 [Streptomyces sp. NPDC055663]